MSSSMNAAVFAVAGLTLFGAIHGLGAILRRHRRRNRTLEQEESLVATLMLTAQNLEQVARNVRAVQENLEVVGRRLGAVENPVGTPGGGHSADGREIASLDRAPNAAVARGRQDEPK
jgi:uncharacterized membrane protein YdbT with pleckstrin-like domain